MKSKQCSDVCVELFPQPMHMVVFNQQVITPVPISLKGNQVEDWTFLKKKNLKNLKKSLTNNPQNNVVGKETYQKAKY